MKTSLIIVATILFIIGIFMLAVRLFFSMLIKDLGLDSGLINADVVCIFVPFVLLIFGFILFMLGYRSTDLHVKQETVTSKEDAIKTLDTRYAKGEITKKEYNEMKKELKK